MEKTTEVLNVTHVASGDLWAGAEAQVFNLVKAQARMAAVRVSVILLNEGTLARELRRIGVTVDLVSEGENGFFSLLTKILSIIRTKPLPGVVHTHRRKENLLGAVAAWSLPGVRSIRTVHGAPEPVSRSVALKQWLLRTIDFLTGRFIQSNVVAVSHELGVDLSKAYGSQRVRVVPNGIDIGDLLDKANSTSSIPACRQNRTKIAFVGRLVPIKRTDLFLEVARELLARSPDEYDFYIYGDGPLRSEIEDYLKRHGLTGAIHCMGFRQDIAAHLARMDMLLMVSDHEGLPMTLLECLALGVPVVARRVGGIPQVLGNGDAGCLVDGGDSDAIVHAVLSLATDPPEKGRIIDEGRRRVTRCFSASACAEQYQAIYRKVTDSGNCKHCLRKQVKGTDHGL